MIDEEEEASEALKKVALEESSRKRAKWDCESVLSTYSNTYNHPALIVDYSRKRKLKPVLKELEVRFVVLYAATLMRIIQRL